MPTELTTKRIEEIAFAVLRSHNDDRLWRALTYDSGPYDVTKATLALQDLASAFFHAGLASAPAAPAQAVALTDEQIWSNDEIMAENAKAGLMMLDLVHLVRAIERAHGIFPKETK